MNEILTTIAKRYSCRDFSDKVPSNDLLVKIAQAGIEAPSAMNNQPWQIIMVKDKQLISELDTAGIEVMAAMDDKALYERIMDRGGRLFYNAPCMAVLAMDVTNPTGYEKIDIGILAQNIVLAAGSLGISSVHCGFAKIPFMGNRALEFRKLLRIPEGYELELAVLLGYANTAKEPHEPDQNKITWIG